MKKSLLLAVVGISVCLCLAGCEDEKKLANINVNENTNVEVNTKNEETNTQTNTEESSVTNTETKVEENQGFNSEISDLVLDDEIIDIDDVPNGPLQDVVVTNIDDSAKGLVYAYYQKKDAQLTFGDVLTNYTDDFTTLRTGGNLQRRVFFRF